jgi:acyl dehydratase
MTPPPWEVGDVLAEIRLDPVSRLSLIKYAGASGDYNPIHTVDDSARAAGLPGIIQHGMLTMAQMSRLLTPYLDRGYIESFFTRFTGMLFLNEVLVISAEVTGVEEAEHGMVYGFDLLARTAEDREIAKGTLTFVWTGAAR